MATILKIYFSLILKRRPIDMELGRKHQGDIDKLEMCPQYTDAPTLTPSPTQWHDPGATYHKLKGLDVGKCHSQLSSPEGIKVINCKRNADVNLNLNLQVNLNLVMNVTYPHTDLTMAKHYMPHSCHRQAGA